MVALLLALKQVLQGNHFSVMQDEKVALLQRLFLRKYNTQECEGTSTFQELVADIFWKKPLMWFTFSPRQEMYSTIHL